MAMINASIAIPKSMTPFNNPESRGLTFDMRSLLPCPLIQRLVFFHGKVEEILSMHKLDLIEFYNKMGISYLTQYCEEEDEVIAGFVHLKNKRKDRELLNKLYN